MKKEVYLFQVACVSYLNLKQNKAFREKIDKCLSHQFDEKMTASMRKILKHNSTRSISLIIFYEKKKSLIFKVLGVTVYCFIDKYVFFIICVFGEKQSFCHYIEDYKVLTLMSS